MLFHLQNAISKTSKILWWNRGKSEAFSVIGIDFRAI